MEQYKTKGGFNYIVFLYFLLFIIVSPFLAYIYAALIHINPFIYINFLVILAFGRILGLILITIIKKSKTRNIFVGFLLASLALIFFSYFSWSAWLSFISVKLGGEISFFQAILSPSILFKTIQIVTETGLWSIKGTVISGLLLNTIWLIEIIILGYMFITSVKYQVNEPFSDINNNWFPLFEKKISYIDISVLDKILFGDIDVFLNSMLPTGGVDKPYLLMKIYYIEGASEAYLSIDAFISSYNKEGKLEFKKSTFYEKILLSPNLAHAIIGKIIQ